MRWHLIMAGIIALASALAGPAMAATGSSTGTTMTVSTNIIGACSVSAATLDFGAQIAYPHTASGTADITVNCSANVPYNIALNIGANGVSNRVVVDSGFHAIGYFLYKDSAKLNEWGDSDLGNTYPAGSSLGASGTGANQTHTVYGSLFVYGGVFLGSYSDTVTVTVYY